MRKPALISFVYSVNWPHLGAGPDVTWRLLSSRGCGVEGNSHKYLPYGIIGKLVYLHSLVAHLRVGYTHAEYAVRDWGVSPALPPDLGAI